VTLSSVSDQGYAAIVNGQEWPASFRPYCANASPNPSSPCPFNDSLPSSPQQLYANSSTIVASMFGSTNYVVLPADFTNSGDVSHPAYYAGSSDPAVTVTCTAYCGVAAATFGIPSQARAAGGSDGHMAVIEPDGTEWDMYGAHAYVGQSSVSVAGLFKTSVLGSGAVPNGGATSGGALAAGLIRFDELSRGVIPHALFGVTSCVQSGPVYPGSSNASICASNVAGAPPVGARFQLTLTDSQIDALAGQTWEKAILHAMHDYGVYVLDTDASSSAPGGLTLMWEAYDQFASFGQGYPGGSFPGLIGGGWKPSGVNWAQDLRIVAPCYALETCSQ
jgi:hypothetical protein